MPATKSLEGLIVKDRQLRDGRPVIADTGATVRTIVGYYTLGYTPKETADDLDLELTGVHAALAYYHLHRDEIEVDIRANSEESVLGEHGAPSRA